MLANFDFKYGLIVFLVSVIPFLVVRVIFDKSQFIDKEVPEVEFYRPSLFIYMVLIFSFIFPGIFFSINFISPNPEGWTWFLFIGIGLGLFAVSSMAFYQISGAYVRVNKDEIEFKLGGKKLIKIQHKDISYVYPGDGYITIVLTSKTETRIPLIFKNSSRLIYRLQNKI